MAASCGAGKHYKRCPVGSTLCELGLCVRDRAVESGRRGAGPIATR